MAGIVLHRLVPMRLRAPGLTGHAVGWPMLAGGIGLIAWAVSSAGLTDVERPAKLVTSGAYAVSRNPMYLGWSLAMTGIGAISRNGWLLIGTLIAAAVLHREIASEEARLAAAFGDAYAAYRRRVRRIIGTSEAP